MTKFALVGIALSLAGMAFGAFKVPQQQTANGALARKADLIATKIVSAENSYKHRHNVYLGSLSTLGVSFDTDVNAELQTVNRGEGYKLALVAPGQFGMTYRVSYKVAADGSTKGTCSAPVKDCRGGVWIPRGAS